MCPKAKGEEMKKWHSTLRERIQRGEFRQEDVARTCGYNVYFFSRALRGQVETSDDFAEKVNMVMDRLEEAERAADAARARVLAGTEG